MSRPLGCLALSVVLLLPSAGRPADGDPLPEGALARIGRSGMRHTDQAFAVAFAPDGKTLASGGDDRLIRLWDVGTGRELRALAGHTDGVNAVAFSSDGKTLASAGEDGTARLWDVDKGKERLIFRGHGPRPVKSIAFAPDDKALATKGEDGAVRLWDAAGGKELLRLDSERGHGRSDVAFAPGGKSLAGIGPDGFIAIWDAKTGKELRRLNDPPGEMTSLAFSPDGKRLASGDLARTVRLWDVEKGKHLRDLGKHTELVAAVRFSPDGKTLASGSADGTVSLWDADGKELRSLRGHGDTVEALAFRADGKVLATASHDRTVRLWDPSDGKELPQSAGGGVLSAALSADGKLVATAHSDGAVRFWDAATGKARTTTIETKTDMIDLAFSPDGTTIAGRPFGVETVTVWDAATGKPLYGIEYAPPSVTPRTSRGPAGTVAFSPDGKVLASVDLKQVVTLYDAKSGKPLTHPPLKTEDEKEAVRVAFAPDGTLAVGYANCHVLFWNTATGRVVRHIVTPNGLPTGLTFSPDGRCLATASGDGGVHLWELATEQERTPDGPIDDRAVVTVAFSADGRLLFGAGPDGVVRVADTWTRKEVKTLRGHRGGVTTLAVAGGRLLTFGLDGTAVVWDVARITMPLPGAKKLAPAQLAALWDDLAADKGADGYRAIGRVIAAGPQAVDVLRERLEKSAGVDGKRIADLIADLDADEFDVREKATKELQAIGTRAVPALKKALAGSPSAEVRQRAETLLKKLDGPEAVGQQQRVSRALEALEAVGSPEAVKVLEALAKRGANDELAQEAKAALTRLAKREAVPAVRLKRLIEITCGPGYDVKVMAKGKDVLLVTINAREQDDGKRLFNQIEPIIKSPEFAPFEINVDITVPQK
jgi:WD40 repeat protein